MENNIDREFNETVSREILPEISKAFILLEANMMNGSLKPRIQVDAQNNEVKRKANQMKQWVNAHIDSQAEAIITLQKQLTLK